MQLKQRDVLAAIQFRQLVAIATSLLLVACVTPPKRAMEGSAIIPAYLLSPQQNVTDTDQPPVVNTPDRCTQMQATDEHYYSCVDRTRDGESATQKGKAILKWKSDN